MSPVEMRSLGFEHIEFNRNPFKNFGGEMKERYSVQYMRPESEGDISEADCAVRLRLELIGETDGERVVSLDLVMVATFRIRETRPEVFETLFQRNTLAIMMPYMRAQVSLATAQPGTVPVVLQPIDINELVDGFVTPDETRDA